MAIFNFRKKNCSNCGWNFYGKSTYTENHVKVSCTCNKKCVNYSQWKPVKSNLIGKIISKIKPTDDEN